MSLRKFRDLSLIDINKDQILVIACDSAGGIGLKPGDSLRVPYEKMSYYTTSVALMELMAFGAQPICLVNNLSVEMEPAGRRILAGIREALGPLDLDDNFITGSTEENIPVSSTGMGITVIGLIDKASWERPRTYPGQLALVVGLPMMGRELDENQGRDAMDIARLLELLELDFIGEILPVGSKGIGYELEQLAQTNGLGYQVLENSLDLEKSAGPSSCVLVSIDRAYEARLREKIDLPVARLAVFLEREDV